MNRFVLSVLFAGMAASAAIIHFASADIRAKATATNPIGQSLDAANPLAVVRGSSITAGSIEFVGWIPCAPGISCPGTGPHNSNFIDTQMGSQAVCDQYRAISQDVSAGYVGYSAGYCFPSGTGNNWSFTNSAISPPCPGGFASYGISLKTCANYYLTCLAAGVPPATGQTAGISCYDGGYHL